MDSLLEKEIQTLAEAFESANNAVFLAISTISNLMSVSLLLCDSKSSILSSLIVTVSFQETHLKFQISPDGEIKEFKPLEVVKVGHHLPSAIHSSALSIFCLIIFFADFIVFESNTLLTASRKLWRS